jgi:hypothetical protein
MPGSQFDILQNYKSLFTGRLGQPGHSTYSHVSVSTDSIVISTYEVPATGTSSLLDKITLVKYCEPYTQREIIYSNNQSFNNVTYIIGDVLRITNNATVTFTNSTLRFYKDAKVLIDPGSRLVLNGTTLTNSCPDKLWYGILVSGNKYLPQTPQNQGVLELKNGAVIENAYNAIATYELKPNGDNDYDTHGGIIRANNATFKNNRRSVEFMRYPPEGTNPIRQNVSYFKNCTFIVDDNNLFTSNPLSQITMWAVTGVQVTGCEFVNNMTTMFENRRAIYTEDAGYFVYDYCTSYDLKQCQCKVIATPSVFKGFNQAIKSTNSTNQYAISIDRSRFQNNIIGIDLTGKNSFRISESDMSLATSFSSSPVGIYLKNCTNYTVEDNVIYSNGSYYPKGIHVYNVGNDEINIYRNTIHHTYDGIFVGRACSPTKLPNGGFPLTGLQFQCNDLQNNTNDIYVCFDGKIRANQGSIGKGADNKFSLDPNAAYNFYVENSNSMLKYYYDLSDSRKNPVNKTSNVVTHNNATTNQCLKTDCLIAEVQVEADAEPGKSLLNSSSLETYRELNRKYSEMMSHFYAKGYDKVLNDYYYNGIIANEELLKEAMAYHEEVLSVTESMAELSHTALFRLKTDTFIDLTQIRDWYEEIYTLNAKYSLAETYYQLGKFEEGFHTLALIPEKYHLTEEEMMEHNNYVSLYTFKNKIRESGRSIAQLNEAEIKQMTSFAEASNGLSSSMTQGILCFFYDICMEDETIRGLGDETIKRLEDEAIKRLEDETMKRLEDETMIRLEDETMKRLENETIRGLEDETIKRLEDEAIKRLEDETMKRLEDVFENITLIPNPTTGELHVICHASLVTNIEIFDVYGRKQSHLSRVTCHENKIDISHLSAGVYFVKITTESGEVVKKVIKK